MAWLLILRGGGAKTRRRQRRSRTRTERKAAKRRSCGQPAPLQHRRAARAASAQLYHAAARVARGRYTRRAARESRRPPTSLPRPRRAVHAPPYARATHLEKWAKELEGRRWTGKGGREASKREPPEIPADGQRSTTAAGCARLPHASHVAPTPHPRRLACGHVLPTPVLGARGCDVAGYPTLRSETAFGATSKVFHSLWARPAAEMHAPAPAATCSAHLLCSSSCLACAWFSMVRRMEVRRPHSSTVYSSCTRTDSR